MTLKDYLHFYPGVYVKFIDEEKKVNTYGQFKTAFITGLFQNPAGAGLMAQLCCTDNDSTGWEDPLDVMVDEFKPILRPLSCMTHEEKLVIGFDAFKWSASQVYFLLSKHFDLFGLIEAGLAIDATTLKI